MTKAEHNVLKHADEALVRAIMQLLEMQDEHNSEAERAIAADKVWRDICHARKAMHRVMEENDG